MLADALEQDRVVAADQVGEDHAPGECGHQAANGQGHVPAGPPAGAVALATELETYPPDDQRGQHDEQHEVEAAEHAGVPDREGGERRAAGHDQPDLVAVPERADRVPAEPTV